MSKHPFSHAICCFLLSVMSYRMKRLPGIPWNRRDQSKLLVWRKGNIEDAGYLQLADYLPSPSLLVFNNSRVVEARILFQKPSGGQIEIFCLEPQAYYSSISLAMTQTGKVLWTCLIGGASKWKRGQVLGERNRANQAGSPFHGKKSRRFYR